MTPKKLSEIGTQYESAYRVIVHGEGIIEDRIITSTVLTAEERRELVREAILAYALFSGEESPLGVSEHLKEFYESEGI